MIVAVTFYDPDASLTAIALVTLLALAHSVGGNALELARTRLPTPRHWRG